MALFFDQEWFDERLRTLGLSRAELATALGLTTAQVDEMWKDQRELKPSDVRVLAALLDTEPAEVARRAGISTPVPARVEADALASILKRLERIEALLLQLQKDRSSTSN